MAELDANGIDPRIISAMAEGDVAGCSPLQLALREAGAREPLWALLLPAAVTSSIPASKSHTDPILEDPFSGADPLLRSLLALVRAGSLLPDTATPPTPGTLDACDGLAPCGRRTRASAVGEPRLLPPMVPRPLVRLARWANPF
ncbi:hypothetical protein EMIHUDRAFT_234525 [Emiliania huxleyi CCMP1516]|uniref:Ankyrin repeat domain-containing protein n=2 Tax=Emiliania huxleyi TaxID=2903 RepID=A0A0D3JZB4_EMIH1|nr:hypothetical protein EMIHUDRAFT_234525 [Emiliania huxleyi CCMP1516]EOD28849.1 hypothetical protein EMIHUDRAFT_234525 [Emiliania huxleyi CCMP1516]|eukprot:XP_005781278.1 hypothetical protein EMIHUDRAFT_234525 [Emiliania huxleyi CCMP1516]